MEKSLPPEELRTQWIILQNSPIEFALLERSSATISKANRAWCKSLGFEPDELEGKPFNGIVADEWFSFDAFQSKCVQNRIIDGLGLKLRHKNGNLIDVLLSAGASDGGYIQCSFFNVTKQNQLAQERVKIVADLETALREIEILKSILPICAHCKRIRNDMGKWIQIEQYFRERSGIEFSHGICPKCIKERYPEFASPTVDSP